MVISTAARAMLAELEADAEDARLVSAAELGDWLGLTANRVSTLGREGVLPRRVDGWFALKASVQAYAARARQGGSRGSADPAYVAAKTRAAVASAEKIEAANAKVKGKLLAAGDVEKAWAGILRDVRAGVLAAPSRIGSRLPHLSAHDVAEIARELSDALADLAKGDDDADD